LAVASNLCKSVVPGLINEGLVRRGYVGLQVHELSPTLAAQLKQTGVVVGEVYPKTPAAKAGLKAGDVITLFAGKPIPDTKTLQSIVISLPINKSVQVSILRNGQPLSLSITIEEQPDDLGGGPPAKGDKQDFRQESEVRGQRSESLGFKPSF
jgi:serine protease Do